ncbi:adenylate kinase family protein [Candidatus Woesearchaeota archaeon]|nr:adenylate kinase family protein [Candidatus Woesearchaeota archaeon]
MKTIIVTGTPGTGKTQLAKKLASKLNFDYIDVNKMIKKYNISEGYDKKRKTKIVDVAKLNKTLIREISNFKKDKKTKGIIIDSHLSHYLPEKYVDLCIVTKCDLKALQERLKKRKYPKEKIRENLDAEIFDICSVEAREKGHNILVIDCTRSINIKNIIKVIIK